jgi:uncharacterized SAM-binding protein YcdF (DUF218 family)
VLELVDSLYLIKVVTVLMLPPGINVLAGLAGLALWWGRRRVAGAFLVVVGVVGLYVLAIPVTSGFLHRALTDHGAVSVQELRESGAGAIVVLGGGRVSEAPEYGGRDTVSAEALVRLRYAARLHRESGLPILVTGGTVFGDRPPESEAMAEALEEDFRVAVRWREGESRNTAENASFTARLLADEGIRRVALVSHSAHQRRAAEAFRRAGLEVVPAPTMIPRPDPGGGRLMDWLPNASALFSSARALHEHLGLLWYRLRY